MKLRSIVSHTSALAVLTSLPLVTQSVHAGPAPTLAQDQYQYGDEPRRQQTDYQSNWSEDQKKDLRHVFYQLEHADTNYQGHRSNAIHEIQQAAQEMGMDLQASGFSQQWQGSQGYGGYDRQSENQPSSDETLRHCQDRLRDLASDSHGSVRHQLNDAAHELDMALQGREQ